MKCRVCLLLFLAAVAAASTGVDAFRLPRRPVGFLARNLPRTGSALGAIPDVAQLSKGPLEAMLSSASLLPTAGILSQAGSLVSAVSQKLVVKDLFTLFLFNLGYKKVLKSAYFLQTSFFDLFSLGPAPKWKESIFEFLDERGELMIKLLGLNYCSKLFILVLLKFGFRIQSDFHVLIEKITYSIYFTHFLDNLKSQYLTSFFPSLKENKRQIYVVNRTSAVVIWVLGLLIACEMIATFFQVPLSSILALGGVGGLAIGLSARDVVANFLGGMMLLFNEPFTPGDQVTFKIGKTEYVGRVERVGWGQTRIRGLDTRPTYIPNSHFVQIAVTNMERITHRKFEAVVPLHIESFPAIQTLVSKIRDSLRGIPKLDILSQPFRVSLVKISGNSLDIEIICYFATKSIDEFLALQQSANLEILRVIKECGASLAKPNAVLVIEDGQTGPERGDVKSD